MLFQLNQVQSNKLPKGKRTYSCVSCGLYSNALNPRMPAYGNFKKGILNIGEAPGETEDRRNRQWQGKVGKILQRTYAKLGIDLFEDCLNINSVNCRPPGNRTPSDHELACCRSKVFELIEKHKPKVIVLLGNAAIASVIGAHWKKDLGGITKWRGFTIPDRTHQTWICPVFHPSFVARQENTETYTIWQQDLERAVAQTQVPFPTHPDERTQVEILSKKEAPFVLEKINLSHSGMVFIDFETTGLKPHGEGHRIVCVAVATSPDKSYAFMLPKRDGDLQHLKRVFTNTGIPKGAANMKFEAAWSTVKLGTEIRPWVWDTMQAAHILDNRQGITSLKFQTYINFGVPDYDSHIASFLKGHDPKNANCMNRVLEYIKQGHEDELLMYCGLDALFEFKLGVLQMQKLGVSIEKGGWL